MLEVSPAVRGALRLLVFASAAGVDTALKQDSRGFGLRISQGNAPTVQAALAGAVIIGTLTTDSLWSLRRPDSGDDLWARPAPMRFASASLGPAVEPAAGGASHGREGIGG